MRYFTFRILQEYLTFGSAAFSKMCTVSILYTVQYTLYSTLTVYSVSFYEKPLLATLSRLASAFLLLNYRTNLFHLFPIHSIPQIFFSSFSHRCRVEADEFDQNFTVYVTFLIGNYKTNIMFHVLIILTLSFKLKVSEFKNSPHKLGKNVFLSKNRS